MKNRKLLMVLIAVVLVASLAGCAPAKSITTGAFDGTAYSNDFFNLSFKAPDGWTIYTKEEMADIFKAGADAVGSEDKEVEKKLKLAEAKTLYMAYLSKFPLDYVDGTNPNINVICENLSLAGLVIKTSKDYAEAGIENFKKAFEGSTVSDIRSKTIGGVDFAVFDITWTTQGVELTIQQLCTVKNNYAIVFTLTYFDDAELAELQAIVDSINFK